MIILKHRIFKGFLKLFFFIFTLLFLIIYINRKQVYPSQFEKDLLNEFFQLKEIKNGNDIIYVQNLAISKIAHRNTGKTELSIVRTIKLKKGLCFDRSLLLQKYFISKGFSIRPVYFFWGPRNTTILDFFQPAIQSHNAFELYYKKRWWLIKTNIKMKKLLSIKEYINEGNLPIQTKYIKYLNNRNGVFIYPNFIPDIYFF